MNPRAGDIVRQQQRDRGLAAYNAIAGTTMLAIITLSALAGCVPGESQSGVREHVKTEVVFLSDDGRPLIDKSVWIVETVGLIVYPTDKLQTDREGKVAIDASCCLPISVAMDGGYANTRPGEQQARYVVRVNAVPLARDAAEAPRGRS